MQPQNAQKKTLDSSPDWLQGKVFTSAAAATALLPLLGPGTGWYPTTSAIAATLPLNQPASSPGTAQRAVYATASGDAVNRGQALLPQVQATGTVAFSASTGSPEFVVAQASKAARSREACAGLSCKGIKYIELQIPKVQQDVQRLESQIKALEASQAQSDIKTYQKVLTERQAEIAQQKGALMANVGITQQNLVALKLQLTEVGAVGDEANFAEQVLAQSTAYQQVWTQLQQVEQSLTTEFSSINLDATALNALYSDYEFHQAELARLASESVSSYIAKNAGSRNVPQFIQDVPAAVNVVQQLAVSVYEYQVEQLRLATIAQIEQKLSAKQRQFVSDMGNYETLQRELAASKQQLSEYEQAKAEIASRASSTSALPSSSQLASSQQSSSQPAASQLASLPDQDAAVTSSTPFVQDPWARLRQLIVQIPEGSVAQGVLYTVLVSGVVAAIAARRRETQRTIIPLLVVPELPSVTAANAYQKRPLSVAAQEPSFSSATPSYSAVAINHSMAASSTMGEASTWNLSMRATADLLELKEFLIESAAPLADSAALSQLASEATPAQAASAYLPQLRISKRQEGERQNEERQEGERQDEIDSFFEADIEADLTIEITTRELVEVVQADPRAERNSVMLPLQDVDAFAAQAVDWLIQDLGLSPAGADADGAEAGEAAQAIADMAANGEGSTYVRPIAISEPAVEPTVDQPVAIAAPQPAIAEPADAIKPTVAEPVSEPVSEPVTESVSKSVIKHPRSLAEAAEM